MMSTESLGDVSTSEVSISGQVSAPTVTSTRCLSSLCEKAFSFVDSVGCEAIDQLQCRTALMVVLSQLPIPMPKAESWYTSVFGNFDRDEDGFIHFKDFLEIVIQYHGYHESRQLKKRAPDTPPQKDLLSRMKLMIPQHRGRLAIFEAYDFYEKAGEGSFGKVLVVKHKQIDGVTKDSNTTTTQ